MVQSFSQVDPFLLLILFENLRISGHFFLTSVLVFNYIGKELPFFIYSAQKSQKIAILQRWLKKEVKWVNLFRMERGIKNVL